MSLSQDLRNFIVEMADGIFRGPVISDEDGLKLTAETINWIVAHDTQFVLSGTNPSAGALVATVLVSIKDASGIVDLFNQTSSVKVSITGGSAAGQGLDAGGPAGPSFVVKTMTDGQAVVLVTATGVGTVDLGLSVPSPAGLTVTSTHTVTFS